MGGGGVLSNWLSFGKKEQKWGKKWIESIICFMALNSLGSGHAPCMLLLTPIFPSVAMLCGFFLDMLTKLLYSTISDHTATILVLLLTL